MDTFGVSTDFNVAAQLKYLLSDGPGSDTGNGFARRRAAATMVIANTKFGLIGIVGMGWAKFRLHLGIRFGPRIFVTNENGNRRSQSTPLKNT